MCGLAVMLAFDGWSADTGVVTRMAKAIEHRGPDDAGLYVADQVGFGFRRLSILDLSTSAHQPMICPDRRYVMVFNGEIYNYLELRRELIACGHVFLSTGDSEVLLHSYIEWGSRCVERLNGMWAFVIYDKQTRRTFGSRDRFGKKPLYYFRAPSCLLFASEIKAILASGLYQGGANWAVASDFLVHGNLRGGPVGDQTFYANIFQIQAGTNFEVDSQGGMRQQRFWSLPSVPDEGALNPAGAFFQLFEDSIRVRLRSDVPVAVFLSGGLDSTSVLCSVARQRQAGTLPSCSGLMAFSYHAVEFDESVFVDETTHLTGAELIRFEASPRDLWDGLDRFLWYQDEPVHSFAALIYFELCRLARDNGVKVILGGGGADEYLAGYFHYFLIYWQSLLRRGELSRVRAEIRAFTSVHGGQPSTLLRSALGGVARQQMKRIRVLRSIADMRSHTRALEHPWFTAELTERLPVGSTEPQVEDLSAALQQSMERAPLPLYLREDDRSSMAHGIEARSPFLDYRLVEQAFRLPDSWKLRGPWNKYLLREAMRGRIPESVRSRPDKMGFPVPRRQWFEDVLFAPMQDLVNSQAFRERGVYRVDAVQRDLDRHRQGKIDCADRLFHLLQFELCANALQC